MPRSPGNSVRHGVGSVWKAKGGVGRLPQSSAPSPRAALARLAVFSDLTDETIDDLASITNLRHYRKDMFIFGEGEPAELFCFVHSGAVKVFKTTADGAEQTLHLLQPGDLFAVTGFVIEGDYPGTAQTLEESWIACIRNRALQALARRSPDLSWALLTFFGERLTGTSRQVLDLGTRDSAGKLAAALLDLAHAGPDAHDPVTVDMHLTHRELAQLIGASRETVTRLLGDFRAEGAVQVLQGGRMTIVPKRLRRYLD